MLPFYSIIFSISTGLAKRLNKEIPNSIILDQYSNPANPEAHYYGTAEEIIAACGDEGLDMIVIGAGTGGTISGTAKRLKEAYPSIKVIGVDPMGSLLADPLNAPLQPHFNQPYLVEGIGYDFVPEVMKHKYVDDWIVTRDAPAFRMARRMIGEEGLLCGGSSGSAMWAALEAIKRHGMNEKGKRVLVLLPDSVRNYMSKFLSADWMFVNGFMEEAEYSTSKGFIDETHISTEKFAFPILTFNENDSIEAVLSTLKNQPSSQPMWPVLNDSGCIAGNLDASKLLEKVMSLPRAEIEEMPLKRFMNKEFLTAENGGEALLKCAAKVPVYLVDGEGRARTDDVGRCLVVDPFKLI